jgi:putative membrane-bound dehydrogenase-like protein
MNYRSSHFLLLFLTSSLLFSPLSQASSGRLSVSVDQEEGRIEVRRGGVEVPVVTQVARLDQRPFLHPIMAPDGKGVATELSPPHHPHQTGLFWGLTRLNGRDYFHNPGGDYWRRVSINVLKERSLQDGDWVQWQTVYDLLDAEGQPSLRESQTWTARIQEDRILLDLEWNGRAVTDVEVGKYDYGGLFLRMPWRSETGGQVVNSARQRDVQTEGQRAVWVDVGVPVDGRDDPVRIAIFDHPSNAGYPQPWRVDRQLGVGPTRSRLGDWGIGKGQEETVRHRLVVYTGQLNDADLMRQWSEYSGQGDWAMWGLAQQAGRQAEFLSPERAVEQMTVTNGFKVNVFAAEPMIGQPMAFCWDARGRLWVAENRDYETRQTGFSSDGTSRILILEDTSGDGVADSSKVFLEGIPFPSAIAVGMGGLWLGAPPNLLFIPDRDEDDRADSDAIEVRLTGWGIQDRHETLNSFHWGPDGWLYGLQGFATSSSVGKPRKGGRVYRPGEAFPAEFEIDGPVTEINGGVWRYHPTKDRFEVVAHGFSNPWGIDFDEHGQFFITACVIPHLWHVIPGGIYHRQGGRHFNPYVYNDIKTIAQHRHQSAHGGARVYQSDAFPETYHGRVFMANIHEHAVLTDIVRPSGSGFVAQHGDDFVLANNAQWIGFSVEVGPEGAVYVLDWHDADICGKEVLHKDTGRIFRIAPEKSRAADFPNRYGNLYKLSDEQLVAMQWSPSVWHASQARTVLQYRAQNQRLSSPALAELESVLESDQSAPMRLRALWTLHVTEALTSERLISLLSDPEPYVRGWAVQLLCEDFSATPEALKRIVELSRDEPSAVVRLFLASAAQRVVRDSRWQILESLVQYPQDNQDHNLPRMIWFALEPLVVQDVDRALQLGRASKIDMISRFVSRRLVDGDLLSPVIEGLVQAPDRNKLAMLLGIRDALEGRFDVTAPPAWEGVSPMLMDSGPEIAQLAGQVSRQFGDAVSAAQMIEVLSDSRATADARREAIRQLAGRGRAELRGQIQFLLEQDDVRIEAIRAIAAFDDRRLAQNLLQRYGDFSEHEKLEIVYTLASRSVFARELTGAIGRGVVPKRDIPAHIARLLQRTVGTSFIDVWGSVDQLEHEQELLFTKYRSLLTASVLAQGDRQSGQEVYQRTCAACHVLHGQGGKIGPDITGANRGSLEYLLSNILTPSAIIQDDYRMHVVLTDDGRIFSGIPSEENERTLKLLVADREAPVVISQSAIESREIASVSLMPEGLLVNLTDQEVVDLFAYLQSSVGGQPFSPP